MKRTSSVLILALKNLVIIAPILGFLIGSFFVLRLFNLSSSSNSELCDYGVSESKFSVLLMGSVNYQAASSIVEHMSENGDQFNANDLILKDSIIVVNFEVLETINWRKYPVIPVVNSEGLGIFYVIQDFRPEVSGTCFSIH